MKLAIFTSVFAALSLTFAAPVPDAEIKARSVATFYPTLAVNIFTPDNGTVKGDVYVSRSATGEEGPHETNSLLSVPFPGGYGGKTCSFSFANGWAPPATIHGFPPTKRVQLFSVGGPISPSNTYTSRPYRNISYGIFLVSDDGAVGTWDGPVPTFPCPTAATTLGFEVTSEGDYDDVSWPLTSGLGIIVL